MLSLDSGERALALCRLTTDGPGLALGTRRGVVKRVNPEVLGKDEWDVIRLDDGDEVVGALELATGDETLCFITSDAQLLHFGADAVRPQGRSGGGMAGIRLSPPASTWSPGSGPSTRPTRSSSPRPAPRPRCPGTEPGAVKVTPFAEYPAKGRATGGVRCHRFLKGEDTLVFAWAGDAPARAAAASGAPVDLPGGRPGGATAPECPGPSRSRPAQARSPTGSRASRLCEADAMRSPSGVVRRLPALGVVDGPDRWRACRVHRRRGEPGRDDGATPEEVLAEAKTILDETSGVEIDPGDRRAAERRHRGGVGAEASACTRRRSRAASTSASTGCRPPPR